jgi:hypothetical protein
MREFIAFLDREGPWYVISVEGIGVTQAATLEEVPAMVIDLISTVEDKPLVDARIEIKMKQ